MCHFFLQGLFFPKAAGGCLHLPAHRWHVPVEIPGVIRQQAAAMVRSGRGCYGPGFRRLYCAAGAGHFPGRHLVNPGDHIHRPLNGNLHPDWFMLVPEVGLYKIFIADDPPDEMIPFPMPW